jgi:anti-sigma B factor antagonist
MTPTPRKPLPAGPPPLVKADTAPDSPPCPAPKVEQGGNVKIITFTRGQARSLENVIAAELEGLTDGLGDGHLLLDFTNVEYITSAELGTLIGLHKRVKAEGGRLTLFNLNPQVFEVFTVTRLETLLVVCR